MARYVFVVSKHHPQLFDYLSRQFALDNNVRVVLDRRQGERRSEEQPAPEDRRRTDRRTRPAVDAELRMRSHAIITIND